MLNAKSAILTFSLTVGLMVPARAATVTLQPITAAHPKPAVAVALCSIPDRAARVDAPSFEYPAIAYERNDTGVALVEISLSNRGRLQSASLAHSSGNSILDAAALTTARMSGYSAERRNCDTTGGRYLLTVEFER
jgi:TonB family protein